MESLQTIFLLLFASILLVGLAQRIHVPYPIALVIGGTFIGFIPSLHAINFDPNLILLIVLPPILYYAAFGIAFREFQKNWGKIFSLALGLVVFTTVIIAVIFKWMFPQFSWPLAFAFGAIVSPPDAIAATTILKRFDINPRLVSLLEGESLINDASAIVLYKLAVVALLSGSFSLSEGGVEFLRVVLGGIAVGVILGFAFQLFSKKYLEPVLGVVFSFTIPYITFILANYLEVSGVLAVVVNGLIGSRILLTHHSSLRRVLGYAVWDVFVLLLNCFVFVLIGLQLKRITKMMTINQMALYAGYALLIAFAMVVVRMIWIYANVILRNLSKSAHKDSLTYRDAALVSWSGMRGIVSLAVAIGLPLALPNGMPIEGRNEVIFMTFVVILITLLIPGLTLPSLIRWLKIPSHSAAYDEKKIRGMLAKIAEDKIHSLLNAQAVNLTEFDFLKAYFISQHYVLTISHETKLQNVEAARIQVIQAQRKSLLEMWKRQEIDDKLLNHLENELDIEEVHVARGELK
jgi:Na+/H+ antiporter